jgi:hypothetical protein
MQTKMQTVVEVVCSTIFAYCISVGIQNLLYPHSSFMYNVGTTAIFTVVSLIRSYFTRRFFNWLHSRNVVQ